MQLFKKKKTLLCRPAAEAEWQLIYQLAHDRYGFLTKERARGIYDGTIFVELEERRKDLHSDA
jgi:peroxygenase